MDICVGLSPGIPYIATVAAILGFPWHRLPVLLVRRRRLFVYKVGFPHHVYCDEVNEKGDQNHSHWLSMVIALHYICEASNLFTGWCPDKDVLGALNYIRIKVMMCLRYGLGFGANMRLGQTATCRSVLPQRRTVTVTNFYNTSIAIEYAMEGNRKVRILRDIDGSEIE
ncbi:uncharacterized protein MCYG_08116 [Microsporum canis CBS 113480]|uniref:Uncharacterized protein n=1 Tax=Arthroderma otae (strain ATCC MYA-4605 / CBS 113480) TaxID=554155 RepID=C5FZJ4_ARTOC|nr:uncharacterized protein MCYG_08116 [Microsporum canis CBS 113480]EEQ35297.1 hypothetical protein MCYG_08116 [Microsporum canis CBS 113480]